MREWLKHGRQRRGNKIRVLDEEESKFGNRADRYSSPSKCTFGACHVKIPFHGIGLHDKWDVIINAQRWLIDVSCTVNGRLSKVQGNISMSRQAENT